MRGIWYGRPHHGEPAVRSGVTAHDGGDEFDDQLPLEAQGYPAQVGQISSGVRAQGIALGIAHDDKLFVRQQDSAMADDGQAADAGIKDADVAC